eukprot:6185574-Pleurochrysis_carterae.AAC.1
MSLQAAAALPQPSPSPSPIPPPLLPALCPRADLEVSAQCFVEEPPLVQFTCAEGLSGAWFFDDTVPIPTGLNTTEAWCNLPLSELNLLLERRECSWNVPEVEDLGFATVGTTVCERSCCTLTRSPPPSPPLLPVLRLLPPSSPPLSPSPPSLPTSCPAADSGFPFLSAFSESGGCIFLKDLEGACDLSAESEWESILFFLRGLSDDYGGPNDRQAFDTYNFCHITVEELSSYFPQRECSYNPIENGLKPEATIGSAICERFCCGFVSPPPLPPLQPPLPPSLPPPPPSSPPPPPPPLPRSPPQHSLLCWHGATMGNLKRPGNVQNCSVGFPEQQECLMGLGCGCGFARDTVDDLWYATGCELLSACTAAKESAPETYSCCEGDFCLPPPPPPPPSPGFPPQ